MIKMKMCNNNNIKTLINIINIRLIHKMFEIWIFIIICILHMNACIEYYCFVLYLDDYARTTYLLPGAKRGYSYGLDL